MEGPGQNSDNQLPGEAWLCIDTTGHDRRATESILATKDQAARIFRHRYRKSHSSTTAGRKEKLDKEERGELKAPAVVTEEVEASAEKFADAILDKKFSLTKVIRRGIH